MTITSSYLSQIQERVDALRGLVIEIRRDPDGRLSVKAGIGNRQVDLRMMRDLKPADDGDVLFVAHAFSDIPRLLQVARSGGHLPIEEAEEMDSRLASTSPGPWTAFIESDGGQAGCDVIRVSESDDEPDMYLWAGAELASSDMFRFVAAARQDIPALLVALR